MRHFIYAMDGSKPALAGGGDTESWFLYYKWNVGGEAFVPVPAEVGEMPEAGDLLWFLLNMYVIGYVEVLCTREDSAVLGTFEVVYNTQDIRAGGPHDSAFPLYCPTGMATEEIAQVLTGMQKYFDGFPKREASELD